MSIELVGSVFSLFAALVGKLFTHYLSTRKGGEGISGSFFYLTWLFFNACGWVICGGLSLFVYEPFPGPSGNLVFFMLYGVVTGIVMLSILDQAKTPMPPVSEEEAV